MREQGLARTTTKEIARAAGCSEALLYKHFSDKQELFLQVLTKRMPPLGIDPQRAGQNTVGQNLRSMVEQLMAFYSQSFPIAASIFSSPDLLAAHRDRMAQMGAGPQFVSRSMQTYLEAEQAQGRINPDFDTATAAITLTGAALHEAFIVVYTGEELVDATEKAQRLVALIGLEDLRRTGPCGGLGSAAGPRFGQNTRDMYFYRSL